MTPSLHTTPSRESACRPSVPEESAGENSGVLATASQRPLKVCIIGLKCFDHIIGKPVPQYLGGIETQLAVLAKGLQQQGAEVSVITYDHGQAEQECFEGVKVFMSFSPCGGIRGVRWFSRAAKLCRAMRRADADVYLQMGAGDETGVVALGRRFRSARAGRFVYCLACDADCHGPLGATRFAWQTALYRYGIRHAELVIAQTENQRGTLERSLGIPSRVVPMAVAAGETSSVRNARNANRILWVGRLMPEKRFEWLLEAARRCPDLEFHVAGTPNSPSDYAAGLLAQAGRLPNVRAHGRMPRRDLTELFRSSTFLCCTSELEGFPTTFLEAWGCGLPVVTTFDPDGIVARHGLGFVAGSMEELVAPLRMRPDDRRYSKMSEAARKYYLDNHSVEAVCRRFLQEFEAVVAR